MESTQQTSDLFNEQQPVNYGMLKVLTVLTFIGCGFAYIGLCIGAARWGSYEQDLASAQDAQERLGNTWFSKFFSGSVEMMQKAHEYRYILFGTGLLFTTMCLIGAIQMRKLKKSGFPIYLFGELGPLVVTAILLGVGFSFYASSVFTVLFVILYATQQKLLIR